MDADECPTSRFDRFIPEKEPLVSIAQKAA